MYAECVITSGGGARGIGEAIVRKFAEDKYSVWILDREQECGEALNRELNGKGKPVFFLKTDITSEADLARAAKMIRTKSGIVHSAVNSVGVFNDRSSLLKTTTDSLHRMLNVNVVGAFLFTRTFEPLLAPNASVVHIGSINSVWAGIGLGAYKVSKAALDMMCRCFALELARDSRKIRVNVVAPGWVDTPGERMAQQTRKEEYNPLDDPSPVKWIPLGKRQDSKEIAEMVSYLCSEKARSITGQIIFVDGGMSAA